MPSRPTLQNSARPHELRFEAIGTSWQLDSDTPIDKPLEASIAALVERFDRDWSRFRDDSLVSRIATAPGSWTLPAEAGPLFDVYRRLYEATDGAMSPLVGRSLETLGYDKEYSLRPTGSAIAAPTWEDAIAWDGTALTTLRPVTLDIGAAGKGYLVDLVTELLVSAGHRDVIVDGSGDIRHAGPSPIRVALEHPLDAKRAIGIASVQNGAICSSASNRRAWGAGLHHVIDATTGLPTTRVIATWAIAATGLEADGLATALFFADPARLAEQFDFEYVRVLATGAIEFSPNLDGELFT